MKIYRGLFLLKLIELTLIISKNWIYYAVHITLSVISLHRIFFAKPANNKTHHTIQQNLIKYKQVQSRLGTKSNN